MTEDADTDRGRGIDGESDVPVDEATAASRATGGDADSDGPEAEGTTGTGGAGEYVGRVSGQDEGYAGLTGAEARALDDDDDRDAVDRDAGAGDDGAIGAAREP